MFVVVGEGSAGDDYLHKLCLPTEAAGAAVVTVLDLTVGD
jgi:hypothetical protein